MFPGGRLDLTARLMVRRAERGGACTGDMGIWMRRPFFDKLGGFPTWAAFETSAATSCAAYCGADCGLRLAASAATSAGGRR